jgi:hypothetical protein
VSNRWGVVLVLPLRYPTREPDWRFQDAVVPREPLFRLARPITWSPCGNSSATAVDHPLAEEED